jgi:hypothetical protein
LCVQGQSPSTEIGRVYVYDKDDWDIADKTFKWVKDEAHPYFSLNMDTGMITMKHGVREGKYSLKFRVQDRKHTQVSKEIENKRDFSIGEGRNRKSEHSLFYYVNLCRVVVV